MATIQLTSANFTEIRDAHDDAGTKDGDIILIPPVSANWGATDLLTITKHIQLIGNSSGGNITEGMDEGSVIPRNGHCTIINVTNNTGKCIVTNYPGNPVLSRISSIVFNMNQLLGNSTYLLDIRGRAYRRVVSGGGIAGGMRLDHIRLINTGDPDPLLTTTTTATITWPGAPAGQAIPDISVVSTNGFPAGPADITIASQPVHYTSKTTTQFIGCTTKSTKTTTEAVGALVETTTPIGSNAGIVRWGGVDAGVSATDWVNGSFDHNFYDYKYGTEGSESNNFGSTGSPLGSGSGSHQGQYQWEQDYEYGVDNINVTYIEDNIFHRNGHDFGTVCGGGRFVYRYNTSWGSLNTHGIDGGNMGPASNEWYHNWWHQRHTSGSSVACCNARGGASVYFNNRISTRNEDLAAQTYRERGALSQSIGAATGRNFLDENERANPLSVNGISFPAVLTDKDGAPDVSIADDRIGRCYARGLCLSASTQTSGPRTYTLRIDAGYGATGTPIGANEWAGFVLVDLVRAGNGQYGDQGKATIASGSGQPSIVILSHAAATGNQITLSLNKINDYFTLATGRNWELRRVKSYFCNPGSGKVRLQSSGLRNTNSTIDPPVAGYETSGYYFLSAVTINGQSRNKYWSGLHPTAGAQAKFGMWQWGNRRRSVGVGGVSPGAWSTLDVPNDNLAVMGGWHSNVGPPTYRKNDKAGDFGGLAYPTRTATAESLRVGAHWQAPGIDPLTNVAYNEGLNQGEGEAPSSTWGAPYPNPLVTPVAPAGPSITSNSEFTVLSGVSVESTFPATGGFQVTTSNLSGTKSYSLGAGKPSGINIGSSSGLITGTNSGSAQAYTMVLSVTGTEGTVTQDPFTIKVNTKPVVSLTKPTTGQTFTDPATVTLEASATASSISGNSIVTIDYYRGGSTLIQSIDASDSDNHPPPYTYDWTGMATGDYAITVKATDSLGTISDASSPAVNITVREQVVGDLTAPTIQVSA